MLSQLTDTVRHLDAVRRRSVTRSSLILRSVENRAQSFSPTKLILVDPGLFSTSLQTLPTSLRKSKSRKQSDSPDRPVDAVRRGDEVELSKIVEYFFDIVGECRDLDGASLYLA